MTMNFDRPRATEAQIAEFQKHWTAHYGVEYAGNLADIAYVFALGQHRAWWAGYATGEQDARSEYGMTHEYTTKSPYEEGLAEEFARAILRVVKREREKEES